MPTSVSRILEQWRRRLEGQADDKSSSSNNNKPINKLDSLLDKAQHNLREKDADQAFVLWLWLKHMVLIRSEIPGCSLSLSSVLVLYCFVVCFSFM
jgi:primase-polymerase (primpol)-like protein